jgi:hypothetical protein
MSWRECCEREGRSVKEERGGEKDRKTNLKTSEEVGDELAKGTLVGDSTGDTLSDTDSVALGEVTGGGGVVDVLVLLVLDRSGVHRVQRTHTAVLLEALALVVEELSRRLGGTGEETTHHDGRRAERESLRDVTDVSDSTVSDDGDAELASELSDGEDGGTLGTTDSSDLLGDADRAGTHADTETVSASGDEGGGLLTADDVAGDDLEVRELLLDPLDHLDLEDGVSLRRVEDDNVETGVDEEAETLTVGGTGTDGGSAEELLRVGLLRGEGVVLVLEEVGTGEESNELTVLADKRKLALLRVTEDGVGLLEGNTGGSSDEVGALGHDRVEGGGLGAELDVATGDDTEELATKLAVVCRDGEVVSTVIQNGSGR